MSTRQRVLLAQSSVVGGAAAAYGARCPMTSRTWRATSSAQTETDSAIWAQLQAQDVNDILWMAGADKLMMGTGGGEFVGGEITTTDPVGPGNFKT
jgi:hypothetical protein